MVDYEIIGYKCQCIYTDGITTLVIYDNEDKAKDWLESLKELNKRKDGPFYRVVKEEVMIISDEN